MPRYRANYHIKEIADFERSFGLGDSFREAHSSIDRWLMNFIDVEVAGGDWVEIEEVNGRVVWRRDYHDITSGGNDEVAARRLGAPRTERSM